jgi:hypothetical protein
MNSTSINQTSNAPRRFEQRLGWFLLLAGGFLIFNGVAELLVVLKNSELLQMSEPLSGISTRWIMLLLGIIELFVTILCLFTPKRILSLWLLLWLALNLIVYRVGLLSMGWHYSYSYLGQVMNSLNLSPLRADILMAVALIFLLTGSIAMLWFGRKADMADKFQKMSCPACGGHIRFATQNLGQKMPCPHCRTNITLRKPENLKMACFFCQEHIEFPAHAIGEKMPCPPCKKDITLKEPA